MGIHLKNIHSTVYFGMNICYKTRSYVCMTNIYEYIYDKHIWIYEYSCVYNTMLRKYAVWLCVMELSLCFHAEYRSSEIIGIDRSQISLSLFKRGLERGRQDIESIGEALQYCRVRDRLTSILSMLILEFTPYTLCSLYLQAPPHSLSSFIFLQPCFMDFFHTWRAKPQPQI